MKPGSAGPPCLGIYPVIRDEEGNEVLEASHNAGNLAFAIRGRESCRPSGVIRSALSATTTRSTTRTLTARIGAIGRIMPPTARCLPHDGYYRILGRVDDVINVAGHRLGTKELESACLTVHEIAEAAVVPVVDDVKGRVPEIYVSLKPGVLPKKLIIDKSPPRSRR